MLPLVGLSVVSEMLLHRIPNDYAYKRQYLDAHSREIDVLFLGSSHVFYGINPDFVGARSFNAGYPSQSLDYDFDILKKYDGRWDNLRCVVVPVDYFSLFGRLESSVEAWRAKNYALYYGIRRHGQMTDNSEFLSHNFRANAGRLYGYYIRNEQTISCSPSGWGFAYSSGHAQNLAASGEIAAKRHSTKGDEYVAENIQILKSIIEYAAKNRVKILLFTSPAYKTYTRNLDAVQLNRTVAAATMLDKTYDNTYYINLLNDKNFTENDFFDADHLNETGARKLTLKIDSLVNALK